MPDLKPELSQRSKYWIPKHRYYELKHYCLQYPEWKKLYLRLGIEVSAHQDLEVKSSNPGNPTEQKAIIRAECKKAMELVERTCTDASAELGNYIFEAVTTDRSYTWLRMVKNIPCGKDMYYDCYRRFFYILSQRRGL